MSRLNVMECRALSLLSSELDLLVVAKKHPIKMLVLYTGTPPPLLQKKTGRKKSCIHVREIPMCNYNNRVTFTNTIILHATSLDKRAT